MSGQRGHYYGRPSSYAVNRDVVDRPEMAESAVLTFWLAGISYRPCSPGPTRRAPRTHPGDGLPEAGRAVSGVSNLREAHQLDACSQLTRIRGEGPRNTASRQITTRMPRVTLSPPASPFTESDDARHRAIASQVPELQFGSRRAFPTIGRDRISNNARIEP